MLKPKIVVWLSHHAPSAAQIAWWHHRGGIVVTPPVPPKFVSGADAWAQACALAEGVPDYVVGVIQFAMLPDYLHAAGNTPLLRADMRPIVRGGDTAPSTYEWMGTFTRTVRVEIVSEAFILDEAEHAESDRFSGGDGVSLKEVMRHLRERGRGGD